MSLDRKSAKKQFIELSASKRENNFNKVPISESTKQSSTSVISQTPASKLKSNMNGSGVGSNIDDQPSNDKIRKATLSPPQS